MTHRTWKAFMIDSVINLLFHCGHRHLTRPFTPLSEIGGPRGETYVVCLDCAKQFAYDLKEMRIGKAIDHSHGACVIPGGVPKPRQIKLSMRSGPCQSPQYCWVRRWRLRGR
jgi:hypothetical protein